MTAPPFEEFIAKMKSDDDPEVRILAHDLELVSEAVMHVNDETESIGDWHNTSVRMYFENEGAGLLSEIVASVIARDPDVVPTFGNMLAMIFQAGYIAGEGPEHIKKCRCGPATSKSNVTDISTGLYL